MIELMDEVSLKWIKKSCGKPELTPIKLNQANLRFLITGGSGFIGSTLVSLLSRADNDVTVITRFPKQTERKFSGTVKCMETIDKEQCYDVIINLAGESITNGRWTKKKKHALYHSRIATTQMIVDYIKQAKNKPQLFLSGSAIGYYGTSESENFTEQSQPVNQALPQDLCQQWEETASQAHQEGVRVCYLRTGLVLGTTGGLLVKLFLPFKLGFGGKLGTGKQWMSWVHLHDWLGIVVELINNTSLSGPVNLTAPNPVTNTELTKVLGETLHRPTFCQMPSWALKAALGEMAEEILLQGQKVLPEKMNQFGYDFRYPELKSALDHLLNH